MGAFFPTENKFFGFAGTGGGGGDPESSVVDGGTKMARLSAAETCLWARRAVVAPGFDAAAFPPFAYTGLFVDFSVL